MVASPLNPSSKSDPFLDILSHTAKRVNDFLDSTLGSTTKLDEAIRYSVLNGGKRFRPFLTMAVGDMFNVAPERSLRAGATIELIHAYSLIHDDLPSMDNSNTRRGQPSCHMQYDEASAILVGDSLIPYAFGILGSEETHPDAHIRLALIQKLLLASGPQGMPLGQMMDLGLEHPLKSAEDLVKMETLKTGELIACACELGGILGNATTDQLRSLRNYGHKLGLIFQIVDDVLDATATPEVLGKPTGQDYRRSKATFISLLGLKDAQKLAENYVSEALVILETLPVPHKTLVDAAYFALSRAQ